MFVLVQMLLFSHLKNIHYTDLQQLLLELEGSVKEGKLCFVLVEI